MVLPPFQEFLEVNAGAVHRFLVAAVGPEEADDCLQETLIAALRAYPRLPAGSNLRAWALTIARRKAIDAHRARGRRPVPVEEPAARAADGSPADAGVDDGLWAAVRGLPPRQRAAVALRYAGDLPHRDVAQAMGCSEEAARRSVHEGLKRLREVLA